MYDPDDTCRNILETLETGSIGLAEAMSLADAAFLPKCHCTWDDEPCTRCQEMYTRHEAFDDHLRECATYDQHQTYYNPTH